MTGIYFALLCLIWGTTWMAIKINLTAFPPFYSAGLRFLLAGFVMLLLMKKQGRKIPEELNRISPSVVFGILNGIAYGLVYWGEQFISSGLTSILNASLPFFSIILAFIFIGEKISWKKIIGSLIGFGGVLLLFYESIAGFDHARIGGEIAIVTSAAVYAMAGVHVKKRSQLDPLTAVTIQMLLSSLVLLGIAVFVEDMSSIKFAWPSFIAFLYLSLVGSAIAFYLYNELVLRLEISKVSYTSMITPAIATLVGVLWLDEPFQWQMLVGMLLIIGGIVIVNYRSRNQAMGGKDVKGCEETGA